MSEGFNNPYLEPHKPSPGELEVEKGNYLLMIARLLQVPMPLDSDPAAFERVGELIGRWFRNLFTRGKKDG